MKNQGGADFFQRENWWLDKEDEEQVRAVNEDWLGKEQRFLLASHLQKAIRRGLAEEASWAAKHLWCIDRGYLAARLGVISVEDVGAGDPMGLHAVLDTERSWGARFFNDEKTPDDEKQWSGFSRGLALSFKDRTPCNWIACVNWLGDFEKEEGPWVDLDVGFCAVHAYDRDIPWWKRGLFAWRAAGTRHFSHRLLPVVDGDWDIWLETADEDAADLMEKIGEHHIEPHAVFLPLALADRRGAGEKAKCGYFGVSPCPRIGPWLSAAVDKHTLEGKQALRRIVTKTGLVNNLGWNAAEDIVGRFQFWTEGSHVDKGWVYPAASAILHDTRTRILRSHNLSENALVKEVPPVEEWHDARREMLKQSGLLGEESPADERKLNQRNPRRP